MAAKFSTGSIGTWLTFAPRRSRGYAATVIAVAPAAVLAATLLAAVATGLL